GTNFLHHAWIQAWLVDYNDPNISNYRDFFEIEQATMSDFKGALDLYICYFFIYSVEIPAECPTVFQNGKLAMSASPTLPTSDNFETRDIRGMVVPAHDCDQAIPNYSTSTAVPSAPLRIGAGHCGSVWTVADASWVIKRADGSKHRSLWKEYYLQNRILSHLDKSTAITTNIQIPASFWYTSTNGCNIMCSERIPPLSSTFRNLLVDSFCPEEARQCVQDRDTVCIGRIYLGRRRFGRPSKFFSLNNYVLLVDSMEQLGLPIHEYAGYIAEALAILHWDAE
ncbi:hypothetical protein D6C83_09312, partial [Aureobasidium pullulans]